VAISPALPQTAAISISERRRSAVSVRKDVAPAPTGSMTTGMPLSLALLPAINAASTKLGSSVPMFTTRAEAKPTISTTSSWACAMTGSAPTERVVLATRLTVT
jgi:hypothetical protein